MLGRKNVDFHDTHFSGTTGLHNSLKARQHGRSPALFIDNSPNEPDSNLQLLTVSEVARFLKISKTGVRRLQQQRRIPFLKIGGSIRFAKSDIAEYLARSRVESVG